MTLQLHTILDPGKGKCFESTVDNYIAIFKVDSGAKVSAVSGAFPNLPFCLDTVDNLLTVPEDQALQFLGSFMATLLWRCRTCCQHVYVVKFLPVPLRGFLAIQALGVKFLEYWHHKGSSKLSARLRRSTRFDCIPHQIPIPLREAVRMELSEMADHCLVCWTGCYSEVVRGLSALRRPHQAESGHPERAAHTSHY